MKINISKLSVKQVVGIGSIIGTISISSLVTFNKDYRTTAMTHVDNLRGRIIRVTTQRRDTLFVADTVTVGMAPETVDVFIVNPDLEPVTEGNIEQAFQEAIQALQVEFTRTSLRFDTIDEALSEMGDEEQVRHDALVARVEEVAAMKLATPLIYVVIDSVLTPVPVDSIHGSEGWLRLLWPWLKEGR